MVLLRLLSKAIRPFLSEGDATDRVTVKAKDIPTIDAAAAPGLTALLDVALYTSCQGELTATVCAAHVLLRNMLTLKQKAALFLSSRYNNIDHSNHHRHSYNSKIQHLDILEQFAQLCYDSANEAIESITQDKFAETANLDPVTRGDPDVQKNLTTKSLAQGVLDSIDSKEHQSHTVFRDECWESPRLYCPDYIWADEVISCCQRLLKNMYKHRVATAFFGNNSIMIDELSGSSNRGGSLLTDMIFENSHIQNICQSLLCDIPESLQTFHAATESNAPVLKRLYLVKIEYRAPFRAFLESQLLVQRTPPVSLVEKCIKSQLNNNQNTGNLSKNGNPTTEQHNQQKQVSAIERQLHNSLHDSTLLQALQLEEICEFLEICIAKILHPFCELARHLDNKKAKLKVVSGILERQNIPELDAFLRRLKYLLCRKSNNNNDSSSSTGIRPLLLELQGDNSQCPPEMFKFKETSTEEYSSEEATKIRFKKLQSHLQCLMELTKLKNGFHYSENKKDSDIPQYIIKGCGNLDLDLLEAQFDDWYENVKQQHNICKNEKSFQEVSENIKNTEIEISIAKASHTALELFLQRLEIVRVDRIQRFNVLQDILDDICFREFDFRITLILPREDLVLELPELQSAPGIFGEILLMEGETLPLG